MRSLPPACLWNIKEHAAHLYWHYGCIRDVMCRGDGWVRIIQWGRGRGPMKQRAWNKGVPYLTRRIGGRKCLPYRQLEP